MSTDFSVRELGLLPHLASRRQLLARSSAGFGLADSDGPTARKPCGGVRGSQDCLAAGTEASLPSGSGPPDPREGDRPPTPVRARRPVPTPAEAGCGIGAG